MKVLYVATVVKTHIMEFHIPYLKMMKEMGWETAVAARNDYEKPEDCVIPYCDSYYDIPFERNPIKPGNIRAYQMLRKIVNEGNYDIVHCHTPVGGVLTRLAATEARRRGTKVFYTAHGFHFFKGAPIVNWVVYYPVERWLAHKTDVLITINNEDYERAKPFKAGKIRYLPGVGVDTKRFTPKALVSSDLVQSLRAQLHIPKDAVILLSVGEVNKNKNHRAVIEALPMLENTWYVICGDGPLIGSNRILAETLGVADRCLFMGYRNDVNKFYQIADIFVFPSLREGLPVSVMEAMATGLPVACSSVRGNTDLIKDNNGGVLFNPRDQKEIEKKLVKMVSSSEVRNKMGDINLQVISDYDISKLTERMKELYQEER